MADDVQETSQNGTDLSPVLDEKRVTNLEDIQHHVLDVALAAQAQAARCQAAAERAMALALSAQAVSEKNTESIADMARLRQLAGGPSVPSMPVPPVARHAKPGPKRDRHGMYGIKGGLAAFA